MYVCSFGTKPLTLNGHEGHNDNVIIQYGNICISMNGNYLITIIFKKKLMPAFLTEITTLSVEVAGEYITMSSCL